MRGKDQSVVNVYRPSLGGVLALGNFDGVHRGHQAVLRTAIEKAKELEVLARVLTFEPHPRSVLKPDSLPFRLTSSVMKAKLLRAYGIDDVIEICFDNALMHLTPERFVNEILIGNCRAAHVVAGSDFVFGHLRSGNMDNLRTWLTAHGVGVSEVKPFREKINGRDAIVLSSSAVREALKRGDTKTAAEILGRPWAITGVVEHGAKRGRTIGIPTANIRLGSLIRPLYGVYAVVAGPDDGSKQIYGVANIGTRPTVAGKDEWLEAHFFDFNQEIYDKEWSVELIHFLRPERTFADIESLRWQIMHDIQEAKAFFASCKR